MKNDHRGALTAYSDVLSWFPPAARFQQHLHSNLISCSTSAGNDFSVQAMRCGVDKEGGRRAVSDHSGSFLFFFLGGGDRKLDREEIRDLFFKWVQTLLCCWCFTVSWHLLQCSILSSRGQYKHRADHLPVRCFFLIINLYFNLKSFNEASSLVWSAHLYWK